MYLVLDLSGGFEVWVGGSLEIISDNPPPRDALHKLGVSKVCFDYLGSPGGLWQAGISVEEGLSCFLNGCVGEVRGLVALGVGLLGSGSVP